MPCAECRFDASPLDDAALTDAIGAIAKRYGPPLTRFLPNDDPTFVLRTRPAPDVWSALEYVAHVRDVVRFYAERIARVVAEDRPQLHTYGFAAACDEQRYNEQDPAVVLDELGDAVALAESELRALAPEQWQRVGIGSEGDERTVRALAENLAHDAHHHLLDVGRSMRAAREAARA